MLEGDTQAGFVCANGVSNGVKPIYQSLERRTGSSLFINVKTIQVDFFQNSTSTTA